MPEVRVDGKYFEGAGDVEGSLICWAEEGWGVIDHGVLLGTVEP